jgi:pilus assembly protein CpaE
MSYPVIAVVSPKGGNGKTTVSANLAVALARRVAPIVVDLDVHFGDIEYALGLDPLYRLDDAVRIVNEGGQDEVELLLAHHPSGISALCAPHDPVSADRLRVEEMMEVVDRLKALERPILLDTAGGISEVTLSGLDRATEYVLVAATDVPSVQAGRKIIHTMGRLGLDTERIHLVVNRSTARAGITVGDVELALGMKAELTVPDSQSLVAGMNRGSPVTEHDPGGSIATAFDRFARRLVPVEEPTSRGLGRLRGRGR